MITMIETVKLICFDKLIPQLQMEIKDAKSEFIKVRDKYRDHKNNKSLFFNNDEYQDVLLDDLVKLSGIEQKLDTLYHVIKLLESGVYDYKH
jgi:hypothetical protein